MATAHSDDVRFTVPLYTTAEVGRYLDVRETTFRRWVETAERSALRRS